MSLAGEAQRYLAVVDTFRVTWTLAATRNYLAASGQTTIVINKATPVVTLAVLTATARLRHRNR